jgi:hypothetical protein
MLRQLARELEILFPPGNVFRDRQVMNFQAQAGDAIGIRIEDMHEALAPTLRQCRRLFPHALRVVAVQLVKPGALTDGAIDQVRLLGPIQGKYIRLRRHEERRWRVRKLTEDRLAADDHDLRVFGNGAGGANQVLKL